MQFYSDYSSEEERDDDEIDLWNPNELIDEILSVQDEDEQLKLKKALLQKFLDQERPLLTSKMRDFFLEDGVTESLMSFVSRIDPEQSEKQAEEANANKKPAAPQSRPLNPPGEEEDVKRSFNVMEIFVNPMHDLYSFLPEKLPVILRELFKVFNPNSHGNFYHFNKILEQLLVRTPSATTKALLNENLLWQMLDFLHETPIIDTLIETFSIGFPRQSDTIQFYKSLADHKMFDRIGEKIYGKPNHGASFVGEFFVKLMEKLSSIEMSGILFISLCRTSSFIDGLFSVIERENDFPFSQRQACASVLRELLLKSGQKVFEQVDFTKPLPNMLSAIHDKLHDYAKVHVVALCNIIIKMDNSESPQPELLLQSYTVKRPFGFYRLMLTDVLSDLIVCAPEVLDKLPIEIWRVLSTWFLEYRYNNLYHFHFWKIYQLIIRDNHVESQKALFKNYKFLTNMIQHYTSNEQSGSRGFIIVMCNTLRFASDLQSAEGFLRHFLISHSSWKNFVTQLRTDTLQQQKRYEDLMYMNEMDEEELDEDGGIDLGSAYARSLGFDEPASAASVESPKPKKKKSKKMKKKKSSATLVQETPVENTVIAEQIADGTAAVQVPEGTTGEGTDWWKNMVDDFKQEESVKQGSEPQNDSWWQELKSELQTMEQEHKDSTANPVEPAK